MKTCFLVLLCFLLCYFPVAAYLLLKAHLKKCDRLVLHLIKRYDRFDDEFHFQFVNLCVGKTFAPQGNCSNLVENTFYC